MSAPSTDYLTRASFALLMAFTTIAGANPAQAPNEHEKNNRQNSTEVTAPLSSVLWHKVSSAHGQYGGAITDVLVDMPTGRILYLVVDRNDPYHYPKAIPADSLSKATDGDFRCSLSLTQWLAAPIVDGTGTQVERFTRGRWELLAYAEPAWAPLSGSRAGGLEVVAPAPGQPRAVAFVSLQRLQQLEVDTIGQQPVGTIAGYLVDWSQHRVTHALIATPHSLKPSYSVPMVRLMPRIGAGASLFVNADINALKQAPIAAASSDAWRRFPERIFRYRAPGDVASNHR